MKRGEVEKYLLSGLWHVHTEVTDGTNSPREILAFAERRGFPLVAFTEHVRADPTYDFDAFYNRIHELAEQFDVECLIGCEAKVLDEDGTLDASPAILEQSDVVLGAFHGGEFTESEYLAAASAMVTKETVDIWAHPLNYPVRKELQIPLEDAKGICSLMRTHDTLFEINISRPPSYHLVQEFGGGEKVIGYDLHDIENWGGNAIDSGE